MPVVVVVVAGPATHFCRLSIDNGDDRMIGNSTALNAEIVDYVAQAHFRHANTPNLPKYIKKRVIKSLVGQNRS